MQYSGETCSQYHNGYLQAALWEVAAKMIANQRLENVALRHWASVAAFHEQHRIVILQINQPCRRLLPVKDSRALTEGTNGFPTRRVRYRTLWFFLIEWVAGFGCQTISRFFFGYWYLKPCTRDLLRPLVESNNHRPPVELEVWARPLEGAETLPCWWLLICDLINSVHKSPA
jgi:hypothetical protein